MTGWDLQDKDSETFLFGRHLGHRVSEGQEGRVVLQGARYSVIEGQQRQRLSTLPWYHQCLHDDP